MKSLDHQMLLMLGPELRMGLTDYASKHRVSDKYAALQAITKQLYNEKMLDKTVYEVLMLRYSRKLVVEKEVKLTLPQLKEKQALESMQNTFRSVLAEWDNPMPHKVGWRESWIRQAEKYKDSIPEARQLLEKIASKVGIA